MKAIGRLSQRVSQALQEAWSPWSVSLQPDCREPADKIGRALSHVKNFPQSLWAQYQNNLCSSWRDAHPNLEPENVVL